MAPRRGTEDLSLTADGSQSRHDPRAGLGVVDQLDLARVQLLHPVDQFRNLRLLAALVLTIFVKALQQRTRSSGSFLNRQPEQLRKMFLDSHHQESLDAALDRGKQPCERIRTVIAQRSRSSCTLSKTGHVGLVRGIVVLKGCSGHDSRLRTSRAGYRNESSEGAAEISDVGVVRRRACA